LTARSPTARALVDLVNRSDLVVYVRHRMFTSTMLEGRIGFVQSETPGRYVIVELACGQPRLTQLATLGHELAHASEIARSADVVSARTLSALYRRIGLRTSGPSEWETYETQAAI